MADDIINIRVTRERFDEVFSIDDSFHLHELNLREQYEYLCKFVVDADGNYLEADEARKLFKAIPRKEIHEHTNRFFKAIRDAFVNPTSGGS